MKVQTAIMA